jgi:hypothetical protein
MSRPWTILKVIQLYRETSELDSVERQLVDDILVEFSRLYEIEAHALKLAKIVGERIPVQESDIDVAAAIIELYQHGS